MKSRAVLCCASALAAAVLLPACGGAGSESSSSAGSTSGGSSSAGGPASVAGGGNSAGGTVSSGAGAGGATSNGGTAGAPVGPAGGSGGAVSGSGGGSGAASSAAGSGGSGGTIGTQIPDTKVVMYLPNWNGSFASWATKVDFNKMTHLNLAFGTVNDGTNDWSMGASDGDVKTLAAAAHAANVKILVSIGGADDDIGIINRYHTESNIDPLVANLDAFIKRLDLDGVDVDLERGNEMQSSGNFPEFLNKIETTLKPEGKLVTAALAQYIVEDAGTDAANITWIKSYDFINLMIYNTNMSTYTNELNWWDSKIGVAKNKLTWGVEFTSKLSTDTAKQLTTASKAYGGVMVWEYSQGTESTLWPAMQSVL